MNQEKYGCDRMALPLEHWSACGGRVTAGEEGADVKPMAAAVAGALISGAGMYAIGTHAQNRFATNPANGYYAAAPQQYAAAPQQPQALVPQGTAGYYPQGTTGYYVTTPQPAAAPVATYYAAPAASYPVANYAPPVANYPVANYPVANYAAAPRQTVYRDVAPAPRYVERTAKPHRSVAKTALVIGGSAAGGAGLGGLIGGKKGALLGAALGGGAASIYEATRR